MSIRKNTTLELLKLLASYMVVFIHVSFYGNFGIAINSLARFAVPLFLLVSGFFSYDVSREKIKSRINYILKLAIFSTVIYTLFNVALAVYFGSINSIFVYFSKYLQPKRWFNFIFLNVPASSAHLWYLFAILYVYVIFYFVKKYNVKEKIIFSVSFALLALHILLGEGLSIFKIVLPIAYLRNFVFMGIPFFVLGLFVKKHEEKIRKIPSYLSVGAFIIGCVITVFSRFNIGVNELYLGSLLILFTIINIFIKYSEVKYSPFLENLSQCSNYIYIFHIIISRLLLGVYAIFDVDYSASLLLINLHPILVCILSTILSYFIRLLTNKKAK